MADDKWMKEVERDYRKRRKVMRDIVEKKSLKPAIDEFAERYWDKKENESWRKFLERKFLNRDR